MQGAMGIPAKGESSYSGPISGPISGISAKGSTWTITKHTLIGCTCQPGFKGKVAGGNRAGVVMLAFRQGYS